MKKLKLIFLPKWEENPYQTLLAAHLERLGVRVEGAARQTFFLPVLLRWKPDILHLHSPDHLVIYSKSGLFAFLKLVIFLNELLVLRWLGVKLVWTAHDLRNHEKLYPSLDRICMAFVARLTHAIFVHCSEAKKEVIAKFHLRNADKVFVIPHGNYISYYENTIGREDARKALGISETSLVMLFLGNIRLYKGIPELIEAFRQVHESGVQLVIAGKPFTQRIAQQIREQIADHNDIQFIPGFIPDHQIQVYMNACDVVVTPFREVLTSGSVILAMSFGRACIAPRNGCLGRMLNQAGAFLYDPSDESGLSQAIRSAIQRKADLPAMGERNWQLARQWNWEHIAETTLGGYRWCLQTSSARW